MPIRWDHPARKRVRTLGQLSRMSARPGLYPACAAPFTFWWHQGDSNFGDRLTPMVLPHYGIVPLLRGPQLAQLFGIGSLINTVPDGYDGWIWGTGSFGYESPRLGSSRVAAVRGPLTAELMNLSPDLIALGDPGLLVPRVHRGLAKRWTLGVIPHLWHQQHPTILALRHALHARPDVTFIDVTRHPVSVCRQLSRCDHVISTSLHGVIVADAYGIPAAWATLSHLEGGEFKFRDHDAAMRLASRRIDLQGSETVADLTQQTTRVNASVVTDLTRRLENSTAQMRDEMMTSVRVSPPGLWRRYLRG